MLPTSAGNQPAAAGRRPAGAGGTLSSLGVSVGPLVAAIVLAVVLQFGVPRIVGPYWVRIILEAGIAMMLAVSLNIVNGLTGQFSIGHAGFMALGGYTAGMITYYGSLWLWHSPARHGGFLASGEWMFAAACVAGGLVASVAGYVVGLPSLRLRGDYLAIVTLGFGEILRTLLQQTNKVLGSWEEVRTASIGQLVPPPVGGAVGFSGLPKYTSLFWVYAFLGMTAVAAYRLKRSSTGRAMMALREDEIAAQSVGVNVTRQKVRAFVLSALFAGMAGGLFAHEFGLILTPSDAGFQRSFEYVIMTVLGGRGSISGVMLAATLVTALPEFLRDFEQYRLIVFAVLLIVMMIVRPQGLLGVREIWDFWKRQPRLPDLAPQPQSSRRSASRPDSALLEVDRLSLAFGGLQAVQDFSLRLPAGALYGLIGPNGAGKTTVFNLLTGIYAPDGGKIRLDAQSLVGLRPYQIAAKGIARTFQNVRLHAQLSVLDNVQVAAQLHTSQSLVSTFLRTPGCRRTEEQTVQKAFDLLAFFQLQQRAFEPSGSLSYGHQRHLEILRALATGPRVLLLDEPAAGLNLGEKRDLAHSLRELRDRFGVSILLIDHDMGLVMDVCERIVVLDHGVTIAEGPPDAIRNDPHVIAAYLGEETD
ncbi:MAG TPA: branched-chain amino acid ABC transporter ATP-binding protein/permease [Planctomycetaceae bacterium]|jgi:branched-chain amino acid transport system permease protein|nr:branched-chain amino acid ABC transporter ATP-binding protein/permease [Planctomycetaceae bacterium]